MLYMLFQIDDIRLNVREFLRQIYPEVVSDWQNTFESAFSDLARRGLIAPDDHNRYGLTPLGESEVSQYGRLPKLC